MKTIGYIRVSTDTQDVQNQKHEILEYANRRRLRVDDWIEVEISSRATLKERRIEELVRRLKEKDTVIVSELSRLGRSLVEVVQLVNELISRRIRLIAIKQNIDVSEKMDMQTKAMVGLFSLFSEIERDIISERTKQALAAKKAGGVVLGKPMGTIQSSRLDEKIDVILELRSKKIGIAGIARVVGCSRQALDEYLKKRISFLDAGRTKARKEAHDHYKAKTFEVKKAFNEKKAALEAKTGKRMPRIEEQALWDESREDMKLAERASGAEIVASDILGAEKRATQKPVEALKKEGMIQSKGQNRPEPPAVAPAVESKSDLGLDVLFKDLEKIAKG